MNFYRKEIEFSEKDWDRLEVFRKRFNLSLYDCGCEPLKDEVSLIKALVFMAIREEEEKNGVLK